MPRFRNKTNDVQYILKERMGVEVAPGAVIEIDDVDQRLSGTRLANFDLVVEAAESVVAVEPAVVEEVVAPVVTHTVVEEVVAPVVDKKKK